MNPEGRSQWKVGSGQRATSPGTPAIPEARRGRRDPPRALEGTALPTPGLLTSGLQDCERRHFVLSSPDLQTLLWPSQETTQAPVLGHDAAQEK